MEEIFIKIRLMREPKEKLTNAAITGDWKVVYNAADAKEASKTIELNKDRQMVNSYMVADFITKSIKRAMKIKPNIELTASRISSRLEQHALWIGEIPEGHDVWLDVDLFRDGHTVICYIKDKLNETEEKTQVTNFPEIVSKIIDKIGYIVKRPVKDPRQAEMFEPSGTLPPVPSALPAPTPPAKPPLPTEEQMDMFSQSQRDYREQIRRATNKKAS